MNAATEKPRGRRAPPDEFGLSLGTNLGDRMAHLRAARAALAAVPEVTVTAASPVYETEPVDVAESAANLFFLNAVLIIRTPFSAEELSERAHAVEDRLGRVRGQDPNAPRTIDVDLIYGGERVIRRPELTLPHPEWNRRRFVAGPLADVRPDLLLPGETRTCRRVLADLPPKPAIAMFRKTW